MSHKLSYEKVKHFIEIESNSGCKLLTKEYIRNDKNLEIRCACGNKFETTYANFVYNSKRQCDSCGINIKRKEFAFTYSEVKKFIEISIKDWKQLKLLSNTYINCCTKLNIEDIDGYKYSLAFDTIQVDYKYNRDFNKFNSNNIYTIDNIRLWLKLNNINYQLLSDNYISATSYLKWECPKGHIFNMTWNNFQNGKRCGECQNSKGEIKIENYLKHSNIYFLKEYKINECRNIRSLPFDFAIFYDKEKKNLKVLIEYDGMQHFIKTGWDGHNNDKLLRTQKTDNIRNIYCKEHNIPLIRIPYWEFDNIEEILYKKLKGGEYN